MYQLCSLIKSLIIQKYSWPHSGSVRIKILISEGSWTWSNYISTSVSVTTEKTWSSDEGRGMWVKAPGAVCNVSHELRRFIWVFFQGQSWNFTINNSSFVSIFWLNIITAIISSFNNCLHAGYRRFAGIKLFTNTFINLKMFQHLLTAML